MPALTAYSSDLPYAYAPGIFPAIECLLHRPDLAQRVLVSSRAEGREGVEKLTALAREAGVRIEEADRALARISGKDNCYAAAVFRKPDEPLRDDLPHVVLHNPSDCGNVGTILRTALGFGFTDIALIRPCADAFDPRTVRACMGSLFQLRLRVFDRFEDYRAAHPAHALYPFMLTASVPLETALSRPVGKPFALVFGNEGSGLPDSFADMGTPVRIPSSDRVDSLNLAIAAGIGLYAFRGFAGPSGA
ncbi:MAG: TrmH family RNA methyltransferase [Clostridia bacterium]|nr:TrmH family RNA methyltransferase [Clostridia bacterium]